MIQYRLDHIMSYTAKLTGPEMIGTVPDGIRANIYVTGGEVTGPKVRGRILPVGGDWLTVRRDGVGVLDVRATIEADNGGLIYFSYLGSIDLGEDGYDEFLRGNGPKSGAAIRMSPRFLTSNADYLWLNRLHCLGIGQAFLDRSEVAYDVYAVL
jgi:Protein of unknown function (DUF3237)